MLSASSRMRILILFICFLPMIYSGVMSLFKDFAKHSVNFTVASVFSLVSFITFHLSLFCLFFPVFPGRNSWNKSCTRNVPRVAAKILEMMSLRPVSLLSCLYALYYIIHDRFLIEVANCVSRLAFEVALVYWVRFKLCTPVCAQKS
jgi:hypothetical protein